MISSDYPGSHLLLGVAQRLGCALDQVNFLAVNICAVVAAVWFRYQLPPQRIAATPGSSTNIRRHLASALIGVLSLFFCFGWDTIHMFLLTLLSYAILRFSPVQRVHLVMLFFAMLYLSCIHMSRLLRHANSYIAISAPLMVAVMKVTYLAHNLHDGCSDGAAQLLTDKPQLRRTAVGRCPSPVEYCGYVLNFHTVSVGPAISFVHYRHFVDHGYSPSTVATNSDAQKALGEQSALWPVSCKLLTVFVCALVALRIAPLVPHSFFDDSRFYAWPLWLQWSYLMVTGLMARMKYYIAWMLADAVGNASGLGLSQIATDKSHTQCTSGAFTWNTNTNVDIMKVEFGSNFRQVLSGWNRSTGQWLRALVYDRVSRHAVVATYVLSAIWHGFHPCYYITFSVGALCTTAARNSRRYLRPVFERSRSTAALYNATGFMCSRLSLAYLQLPFVTLDLHTTFRVYRQVGFLVHVVCFGLIFILPSLFDRQRSDTVSARVNNNSAVRESSPDCDEERQSRLGKSAGWDTCPTLNAKHRFMELNFSASRLTRRV